MTEPSATPRTKAIFEKALAAAERAKDGTVKQMLDALLGAIHDDVSQLERELSAALAQIEALNNEVEQQKRMTAHLKRRTRKRAAK